MPDERKENHNIQRREMRPEMKKKIISGRIFCQKFFKIQKLPLMQAMCQRVMQEQPLFPVLLLILQ